MSVSVSLDFLVFAFVCVGMGLITLPRGFSLMDVTGTGADDDDDGDDDDDNDDNNSDTDTGSFGTPARRTS